MQKSTSVTTQNVHDRFATLQVVQERMTASHAIVLHVQVASN